MDRTLSTIWFHHQFVSRATVELIKQGAKKILKKWMLRSYKFLCKYICCFIFVLISTGPVSVQDSEWMFMIFSYLPLFKLRLTTSHGIFYHFIVCYFLVCKSLPKSQLSSKFHLDCSSMCMVIDLVTCRHWKISFPNLCRKTRHYWV